MEKNDSIGVRLREVREKMELSQTKFAGIAEAAGATGTTRQSQSNYEKGKRMPDASYFSAIAAAGADIYYILVGRRQSDPVSDTLTPDEATLLRRYRAMSKEARRYVQMLALASLDGDVKSGTADRVKVAKDEEY